MQNIIKIALLLILAISYSGCASSKPDPRVAAMIKKMHEERIIKQMKRNEAIHAKQQEAEKLAKQKQENAKRIAKQKQEDTRQWKRFAPKYNNHYKLVQAWKKAGFSAKEAIEWEKYISTRGLYYSSTARSVKKSIQQGATLPLVKRWESELGNKIDYYEVADLIKNNLTLAEVKKSQTEIRTKFDWGNLIQFKKRGFSTEETIKFINAGFDYFGAEDCKKLGITKVEDAIKWGKANDLDRCEENVIAYKKVGFTPDEYRVWSYHGFDPKKALKWKIVGAENAVYWYNYNQYAKNKYTPKEAKEWQDIEVLKPEEADKWRDTKLAKSTIKKFRKNGVMAKTILKLQKIKVKSTKMALLMAEGDIGMKSKKDFLNKSKILKRNYCKKINIIHVKSSYLFGARVSDGFYDVDEYDNKGKCYQFTGELIQRIDRKHGLVQNGDFLYYVTFNKSWREGTTKIGVLKGDGAYSYTTAMGARKTIPKGKILFFDD